MKETSTKRQLIIERPSKPIQRIPMQSMTLRQWKRRSYQAGNERLYAPSNSTDGFCHRWDRPWAGSALRAFVDWPKAAAATGRVGSAEYLPSTSGRGRD